MLTKIAGFSASNHNRRHRTGRSIGTMRVALWLLGAGLIGLVMFSVEVLVAPLVIHDSGLRGKVLVVARWALVGLIPIVVCGACLAAHETVVAWHSRSPNRRR
jgi:hypothetical protein